MPGGTKPLPETVLTSHQWRVETFTGGPFHKRYLSHQSLKLTSKLLPLNLPWANELTKDVMSILRLSDLLVNTDVGELAGVMVRDEEVGARQTLDLMHHQVTTLVVAVVGNHQPSYMEITKINLHVSVEYIHGLMQKRHKYRLKRKDKKKVARRYFIKWKVFFVKINCRKCFL